MYCGLNDDNMETQGLTSGYTTDELLEHVQISRAELLGALRTLPVVEIKGRWHALDPEYIDTLLQLLLLCAAERGWSIVPDSSLELASLRSALIGSDVHADVADFCLQRFGSLKEDQRTVASWSVNSGAIVRQVAARLLGKEDSNKIWLRSEFERAWAANLPEVRFLSMRCGEECLVLWWWWWWGHTLVPLPTLN